MLALKSPSWLTVPLSFSSYESIADVSGLAAVAIDLPQAVDSAEPMRLIGARSPRHLDAMCMVARAGISSRTKSDGSGRELRSPTREDLSSSCRGKGSSGSKTEGGEAYGGWVMRLWVGAGWAWCGRGTPR